MPFSLFETSKSKAALPNPADNTEALNNLANLGFPKKVSEAFQKAADELNCVILSRVPGEATTTMIDEGFNLKPFYIHGKSCSWGPMAGFACQLPALNKAGTKKMAYNLNEHLNSLKWLDKKQTEYVNEVKKELQKKLNGEGKDALLQAYNKIIKKEEGDGVFQLSPLAKPEDLIESIDFSELEAPPIADSLFLPLSISEKRKKELIDKKYLGDENKNYKFISSDLIVGIALDKDKTVAVEYLMKRRKAGNFFLWDIYHKDIHIKKDSEYVPYIDNETNDKFSIVQPGNQEQKQKLEKYNKAIQEQDVKPFSLNDVDATFRDLAVKNQIQRDSHPLKNFYPLNGLQSPYLVYKDKETSYKNAVLGDYDLFAVWPFVPTAGLEMATRISELKSEKSPDYKSQNLFMPVESKKYALEITKSRNVFIEFIGSFEELEGIEDPETGNINELVAYTAQMLNSLIMAAYQGESNVGVFPNRAFHSDEGGRPQVDEVEYPIAFFMPKAQWGGLQSSRRKDENQDAFNKRKSEFHQDMPVLKSTAGPVNSHVEFLSLILELKKHFYIFLHDGWVMHLMCLAAGKDINKKYKLLDKRAQDKVLDLLKRLIIPMPSQPTSSVSNAYNNAFQDLMDRFTLNAGLSSNTLPSPTDRINALLDEAKIEIS